MFIYFCIHLFICMYAIFGLPWQEAQMLLLNWWCCTAVINTGNLTDYHLTLKMIWYDAEKGNPDTNWTPKGLKTLENTSIEFVLRKSFCIYRFEQTSRYRQRVLIYRAAQDVKMSAKTMWYLQTDYSENYRLGTSFITKLQVLYTVSQIPWTVQLKTKKW